MMSRQNIEELVEMIYSYSLIFPYQMAYILQCLS